MRYRGFLPAVLAIIAAASVALLVSGALTSRAVQDPTLSLDMVTIGNGYDDATNTMTLGAIENCLTTTPPGTNTAHIHTVHLVIQNVEDLIGWQARFNYVGDQFRPNTANFIPFTDNNTGQSIGFTNLPIDQTSSVHRNLISSASIPPPLPGPQTAAMGASYLATQNFAVSPDTPSKPVPDDSSYSAPTGGVLASFTAQVLAGNAGNPSLFLNLDDSNPSDPGSGIAFFNGTSSQDVLLPPAALGDAYHGEGAPCVALDCITLACPSATVGPTGTPFGPPETPTPTSTPPGVTPSPTPTAMTTLPPGGPTRTLGGVFKPELAAVYSSTDPGSRPDINGAFSLGLGPDGNPETSDDTADYNIAGIVNFLPSAPRDSDVPDGAILGTQRSLLSLGVLNNPCTVHTAGEFAVNFTFEEATTDINNTVEPRPFGAPHQLALLAGDLPPFNGFADVDPPPGG